MSHGDLTPLTPELYGQAPEREASLTVVERWADCIQLPPGHPRRLVEFLHRQMNEEANVLENAAGSLVDFPEADWEIRMWLARQCADEARHVTSYKLALERRGGRVGQFPVMNFQYRIVRNLDSLVGRLAVQNRTFEADGLDAAVQAARDAREAGDEELAAMYDSQGADEVVHVGFANDWIRREIKRDPRCVLRIAESLSRGARAFVEIADGGGREVTAYGVAHEERQLAGFAPGEIAVAHEITEARRAAVRAKVSG